MTHPRAGPQLFLARHLRKEIASNTAFHFRGSSHPRYSRFSVRRWFKLRVSVVDFQEFDGLTLSILHVQHAGGTGVVRIDSLYILYKFSSSNSTSNPTREHFRRCSALPLAMSLSPFIVGLSIASRFFLAIAPCHLSFEPSEEDNGLPRAH